MLMPQRIALGVRYDGARYHGWQLQDNLPTIQLFVEKALTFVANHSIHINCAGRTDAGVHASCQVMHFDTEVDRADRSWVFGTNSNLPHDISVLWARKVDHEFHARFSATSRKYRYVIYNHDIRPGILRRSVGWYHRPLDAEKMQEAADLLTGKHDFSSFRGSACEANNAIRTLQELKVERRGKMVVIEAKANAFLLHMVRNLVGVLLRVGCGDESPQWAKEVLHQRDRRKAGVTFPPNGLYLVQVDYPLVYDLPVNSSGPFFLS